jgi:ADP-ribose pyrophosphatase
LIREPKRAKEPSPLPPPPRIAIAMVRDRTATSSPTGGFLNLRRLDVEARYPGGDRSAPFPYDIVTREALDAVVIAAHYEEEGTRRVYLRSAIRPPLALRTLPPAHNGDMWELPAGLIDPGETPVAAAARELEEELGFTVHLGELTELGSATFPCPGFIAEQHHYFHVEVDPSVQKRPTEDGSALERGALIVAAVLEDALEHCRRGAIVDAKTELALRRLMEALP